MNTIKSQVLKYIPPLLVNAEFYDAFAEIPDKMNTNFPDPAWTYARKTKDGGTMPQTIAHRGYKAKYPENTMGAFRGAVEVGADAIETDIHLSKDDVVVLSHDATLKRCFGTDEKIIDCEWEYLQTLHTIKEPHEPLPRLVELLTYLASPGLEDKWLLLDIKLDSDADTVMRLIADAIFSVPPNPSKPWNQRIVLGIWAAKYLPLCSHYLPDFPISHIGFSTIYARQFLRVPNVSFNLLQKILYICPRFIKDAHALKRAVFVWTVNEDEMMRWSIKHKTDGVITDDPKRFQEVKNEWVAGNRSTETSWVTLAQVIWIHLMVSVFGAIFRWKYGSMDRVKKSETRRLKAMPLKA
ncbi:MAG: hypothetical protein MMC33_000798 [Icmadophila ericetorum]|nr:hypothetical protein [Icmadophila ericetorum]